MLAPPLAVCSRAASRPLGRRVAPLSRMRTSARRSRCEGTQLYSLAVPTEKEGATHDQDRADRPVGLLDRLVRRRAPAGSARCSRPARARTP